DVMANGVGLLKVIAPPRPEPKNEHPLAGKSQPHRRTSIYVPPDGMIRNSFPLTKTKAWNRTLIETGPPLPEHDAPAQTANSEFPPAGTPASSSLRMFVRGALLVVQVSVRTANISTSERRMARGFCRTLMTSSTRLC